MKRWDEVFIAHIREKDHAIQTVQEHLVAVSELSGSYGKPLGIQALCELAGLLHDMGKYTDEFTDYIQKVVIEGSRIAPYIDHSTAGAKYLWENYKNEDLHRMYAIELVSMSILSHHSGLQDFLAIDQGVSSYIRRVVEKKLPYYDEVVKNFEEAEEDKERVITLVERATKEVREIIENIKKNSIEREGENHPLVILSYYQKLIFSCLVDADRTDTRRFEEQDRSVLFPSYHDDFEYAYTRLNEQLDKWNIEPLTKLNKLRSDMSKKCDELADKPSGIYTLSIPTGGGKTLASLRYALKHALHQNKKRIIYIVPYTTILEQNAKAVRKYFANPTHVLEHHANVIDDTMFDNQEDYYGSASHKKIQLGRDNWDYPVIFTTMVQFLDAYFAKGTRKARRLHNLTEAVIIFDEVQSVPFQHQELFNTAVNFLVDHGKSSVLLCTATQPTFGEMEYPIYLQEDAEMVPDLAEVAAAFERVKFHNEVTSKGFDQNALTMFVEEQMNKHRTLLIILNTKKAVLELYQMLDGSNKTYMYHLSTSMCPAHRNRELEAIRKKLDDGAQVVCISTQLIEAGVDISFEAVIRSLTGLDSIAQAAGRCNRNGEKARGDVYLIKYTEESLRRLPEIRIGAEITENYIFTEDSYLENLLQPTMITRFFSFYYPEAKRKISQQPNQIDRPLIYYLDHPELYLRSRKTVMLTMYQTVEKYFKAIDSPTTAIIVPYNEDAKRVIADLNEEQSLKKLNELIKRAQQYVVNVFDYTLQELVRENLLVNLYNDSLYVLQEDGYSKEYGISIKGEGTKQNMIF